MMIAKTSRNYTAQDLDAAIRAANARYFWASFPFAVTGMADSGDRADAIAAWQRVAEIAAWLWLHAQDGEGKQAAADARQLAEREIQRLRETPMQDDTRIDDTTRREVIAATDGHEWRSLPASVRSAIQGRYVPASVDLDDSPIDRLEADALALKPAHISSRPRPAEKDFRVNTD